jgi:excisionase family DNA binding protein
MSGGCSVKPSPTPEATSCRVSWLTIKQAAEQMQVSTGTIRSMIESGRIRATLVGSGTVRKTYRIPAESLEQIKELEAAEPVVHKPSKLRPSIARAMGVLS